MSRLSRELQITLQAAIREAVSRRHAYVTVEHILIAVPHQPEMRHIKRTKEEAKLLVDEILAQLKDGADFEKLKQMHSDDRQDGKAGGSYAMANRGMNPGEATPRENMVKGFGDVSFTLEVGEVGVAEFDPSTSKWGYHIIKRVK